MKKMNSSSSTAFEQRPRINNKGQLTEMYPEYFNDSCKSKDFEYHIVKLVSHAPRKISVGLKEKLKRELKEMVEKKINEKK